MPQLDVLFVHTNFPAQFRGLAEHLQKLPHARVRAIASRTGSALPGVEIQRDPHSPDRGPGPASFGIEQPVRRVGDPLGATRERRAHFARIACRGPAHMHGLKFDQGRTDARRSAWSRFGKHFAPFTVSQVGNAVRNTPHECREPPATVAIARIRHDCAEAGRTQPQLTRTLE